MQAGPSRESYPGVPISQPPPRPQAEASSRPKSPPPQQQGYPPQQAYPPQYYPPQGYPPQGYPPQYYPQQGYPPPYYQQQAPAQSSSPVVVVTGGGVNNGGNSSTTVVIKLKEPCAPPCCFWVIVGIGLFIPLVHWIGACTLCGVNMTLYRKYKPAKITLIVLSCVWPFAYALMLTMSVLVPVGAFSE